MPGCDAEVPLARGPSCHDVTLAVSAGPPPSAGGMDAVVLLAPPEVVRLRREIGATAAFEFAVDSRVDGTGTDTLLPAMPCGTGTAKGTTAGEGASKGGTRVEEVSAADNAESCLVSPSGARRGAASYTTVAEGSASIANGVDGAIRMSAEEDVASIVPSLTASGSKRSSASRPRRSCSSSLLSEEAVAT